MAQAPKPAAEPAPYQDKVIEGLPPLSQEAEVARQEYDAQGWPRGLQLQLTRNIQTSDGLTSTSGKTRRDNLGIELNAFIDTPDYGALSIQLLALGGRSASGLTSWSVRQTGMPFDGGWRLDNVLGATSLALPDISRRSSRLAIPSTQVLGGSMLIRNVASEAFTMGVSVGEPGRFDGFPQSRFVGTGGEAGSMFVQTRQGDWSIAAVAATASNIVSDIATTTDVNGVTTNNRISPRALYVTAEKNAPGSNMLWQISTLSTVSGAIADDKSAYGVWTDLYWRDGSTRQQASLFRFAPALSWLDRPLISDLQGVSYRYDYNPLRWDVSATLEAFNSVTGQTGGGWYGNLSTRWRLSSGVSTGAGAAVRQQGATSASGFGYVQWHNDWGNSRVQLDMAAARSGANSQALSFENTINSAAELGLSLSTTLSFERINPAAEPLSGTRRPRETATTFGLNGRAELMPNLSVQASLKARQVRSGIADDTLIGNTSRGTALSANIGLDWQISRDWSLGASYYENRGAIIETLAVRSPLTPADIIRVRPNDRGIFINLRYATRAGSISAPLGGPPGSGAGRIEGTVYLDSNGNGMRDANENGAANIQVLLDSKFMARTNSFGGFEFASVVAGTHTITVVQDDLPLPWALEGDVKFPAVVSTRGTTRVEIGAKRIN